MSHQVRMPRRLCHHLLGSSKHISIGPFALVSILVAETVSPVVAPEDSYGHHRPEYGAAVCLHLLGVDGKARERAPHPAHLRLLAHDVGEHLLVAE